jgi:hypothetical protein
VTLTRAARATAVATLIAATLAAMFVWTAGPVLGACTSQTSDTAHARWNLRLDAASCTPSVDGERYGDEFETIVPGAAGFVALGRVAEDPATAAPRAWASFTSSAGDNWTAHALPFPAALLEGGVALASRAGVVEAVGAGLAGRSADGISWTTGTAPPSAARRVTAVTGSATGWLAVGQTTRTSPHLAVWLSADGLAWRQVRDQPVFGRFCATAAAWRANRYVIVGSDCNGRPAALTSTDGLTWRRAPVGQTAFARLGVARDVIATATGFLAAGEDRSAAGARGTAFWTSTDGLAWRRVAFFTAERGGETFVRLVRTTAGYFGISDIGGITDGRPPAAFYSATASLWRRDGLLPNPDYGSEDGDWLTDATAVGNRIVLTGRFNDLEAAGFQNGGLITTGDAHN